MHFIVITKAQNVVALQTQDKSLPSSFLHP